MTRTLSTEQLRWLNDEAVRKNANRALSDEFWPAVDPDGIHVVMLTIPYGRNSSGPCDRVMILCKMLPGQGTVTHEELPRAHIVIDVEFGALKEVVDSPAQPLFDF